MQKKNNDSNTLKLTLLGASLAGLAASAYFFLGHEGKKNRRHAKAWAIKMKGDVVEKLEKALDVTEPIYHQIIDSVSKDYEKGMRASKVEIAEVAKDLKKHWKTISVMAKASKREIVSDAGKVAKKAGL